MSMPTTLTPEQEAAAVAFVAAQQKFDRCTECNDVDGALKHLQDMRDAQARWGKALAEQQVAA